MCWILVNLLECTQDLNTHMRSFAALQERQELGLGLISLCLLYKEQKLGFRKLLRRKKSSLIGKNRAMS